MCISMCVYLDMRVVCVRCVCVCMCTYAYQLYVYVCVCVWVGVCVIAIMVLYCSVFCTRRVIVVFNYAWL